MTTSGLDTTDLDNPNRTQGSSSCGSAAAVADCQVPLALGTYEDSIIPPASPTGVFGMGPIYDSLLFKDKANFAIHAGRYFARSVEDIQLLHYVPSPMSTLPYVIDALYNSGEEEGTCLLGTRTCLLRSIEAWIDSPDEGNICWLTGIAGGGKSTFARTIARTYDYRKELAGSFLFSRGGGDKSDGHKLITTLAHMLAERIPSTRPYMFDAIQKYQINITDNFHFAWEELIINPLSKVKGNSPPSTVLFVIDALDECDDESICAGLSNLLTTTRVLTNIRLRILITSRPEALDAHVGWRVQDKGLLCDLRDFATDIDRDIGLFLTSGLGIIQADVQLGLLKAEVTSRLASNYPDEVAIERLVKNSFRVFAWASIASRFILEDKMLIMERNDMLTKNRQSTGSQETCLDEIYTTVLRNSIKQNIDEKEKKTLMLREVLGSILIILSPLSMESLAKLLVKPLDYVENTLRNLHSIINIHRRIDPMSLRHSWLRDFLLDQKRCDGLDLWIDETQVHRALAKRCVGLMSIILRSKIREIESSDTLMNDILTNDPYHNLRNACIPHELQYACLYWLRHCDKGELYISDDDPFEIFFRTHFHYWRVAINLIGRRNDMYSMLRVYNQLRGYVFSNIHIQLT